MTDVTERPRHATETTATGRYASPATQHGTQAAEPEPVPGLADELIAAHNRLTRSLRNARIRKGLSVETVAERCNLPADDVRRFEHGDVSMSMRTLLWYAHAIDVQITYTLTDAVTNRA